MTPRVAAVILAAGEGRRAGGNKGLLAICGRPAVRVLLDELRASRAASALVVTGAESDALAAEVLAGGGTPVHNPDWRTGQSASVQAGVAALPADVAAFLLLPVDHVLTRREDVDALIAALRRHPAPATAVIRPVHGDAYGHPVLFGRDLAREFLALAPGEPAHAVYRRHRARAVVVPVDNPWIAFDVDTPEDRAAAERVLAARGG